MFARAAKITSTLVLVLGLFAGVIIIRDTVSLKGRASGTPANLVVDLSSSFVGAKNTWQFLAQGGEEKGRSLSNITREIKNIEPQYIRIDHIFDFFSIVSSVNGNTINYNWTTLDGYLSDIAASGAKPFLALSYAPVGLATNDTDMPNLTLWKSLVKATVEHVSGKNNLGIKNVYYEVWNEPDLFGQFKVYPPKDYRDLYKATSDGALSAQNVEAFKLGGPGTTALYKNWFDVMVDLSVTQRVKFDFFSWHQYGSDNTKLDQNITDVNIWKAKSGLPNLELFITEQGIDAANNSDYDGSLSAFNTLSAVSLAADRIDGLMSFEIKDGMGPTQKWGRWGLLTHEKYGAPITKPRYQAFEFLKRMKGDRLNIAGNGSFVSSFGRQDKNSSKLFVVNYDPEYKHVEAVPIRFTGITASKFLFVRNDFQGGINKVLVVPTNGEWSTVQYFKANAAAVFELIPQN